MNDRYQSILLKNSNGHRYGSHWGVFTPLPIERSSILRLPTRPNFRPEGLHAYRKEFFNRISLELPFRPAPTTSNVAADHGVVRFNHGTKSWCAHPFSRHVSRQAPSFALGSASIRFWSNDPSKPEYHDFLWLAPLPADALLDVPRDLSTSVQLLQHGIPIAVFTIKPTYGRLRVSMKPDSHGIPIIGIARIPSNPNLVIQRDTGQPRGFRELLIKRKI